MKTKLFTAVLLLMAVVAVKAQYVAPGSSVTFHASQTTPVVTLDATTPYIWAAYGSAIASKTANADGSYSVTFSNNLGDVGEISVYGKAATGCTGDTLSLGLTVHVLKYSATFPVTSETVCPKTTSNTGGGIPGNVTVNFTGGNVSSFNYSLDGSSYTVTLSTAGTTATIDLSAITYSASDAGSHTLEITSITGTETDILSSGTDCTLNVSKVPVIGNIF